MLNNGVSIVVPAYNEDGNILLLARRIYRVMKLKQKKKINYEIIVIDDNSTDNTWKVLTSLDKKYRVRPFKKNGLKGKAYSLIQGFKEARYDTIAMIDADLQYPPEAIPGMYNMIGKKADVVVADRRYENNSLVREMIHDGFRYLFGKALHGLTCDVQSGLKVFKKSILDKFDLNPTEWTFDLEFLLKSIHAGYKIADYEIVFTQRHSGYSKVDTFKAIKEIGMSAIEMKIKPWRSIGTKKYSKRVLGKGMGLSLMKGFHYNGKKYVFHSDLNPKESAFFSLSVSQKAFLIFLAFTVFVSLLLNWHLTLVLLVSMVSVLYFADLINNFMLLTKSVRNTSEITISRSNIEDDYGKDWPKYTILCPLYKEAQVVPQFVEGIEKIDYPKDKLQVMLLLEKDDKETIEAAESINLPSYFEIVKVPPSLPRTKPKACNYGLQFAKGEYTVIYDAEDVPDRYQLKKAVIAFESVGVNTQCMQAKLNFYNPSQNLLTKMFTGEYSLWFDFILTGLQASGAPIPLGGTSNHFRTAYLREVNGWDAFNVTEDCDLGMRLAKKGSRTAIINSTTLEEANSDLGNWFNQRTRWVKGYIQTYLVHMRDVKGFIKKNGIKSFMHFQLVVGSKVLSMLVNPVMWFLFIIYFIFRSQMGHFIESLFPPPIFYIATFSLVVGNFIYFYNYMIALAARGNYRLVKYAYLVPFYWLLMSAAAWTAVYRLIKNPHHWSKTVHGLHLIKKAEKVGQERLVPAYAPSV